jgi:hypothetical protein
MLARLGLFVVVPLLLARMVVMPQLVTATQSDRMTKIDLQQAASIDVFTLPHAESSDSSENEATDVYGNEVSSAVAQYKLDATGTMYELHSPQTELPRLGSPKS